MMTVKIYLCLSLTASLILCSQSLTVPSLSESLNAFALNFLEATIKNADDNANLALSPYTMYTMLSLLSEGAKGNTGKQLEQVLQIPSNKGQFRNLFKNLAATISRPIANVSLETSNAAFGSSSEKIKEQFLKVARNYYNVDVIPTDFTNKQESADVINKYISKATKNRINDFIEPEVLSDGTKLFLASTLYFRGPWLSPFDDKLSLRGKFYNENLSVISEVDLMYQSTEIIPYANVSYLKSEVVELPYGDGSSVSMYIILPHKGETIKNVLDAIKSESIDNLLKYLPNIENANDLDVLIPKFSAKTDLKANDILKELGIVDLFDETKSDLSGIYYNNIFVSSTFQKSEIEVDEHGSAASSASGSSITDYMFHDLFNVDRPFLYFIVDKVTKAIVFCGKIGDPSVRH